jgi:outer membrane protein assembly factor BamB
VVWKLRRGVPAKPSPLLVGELIYMVDDSGVASCAEAKTGQIVWQKRIGGQYSASPIYAQGRIYCFSHQPKTTVLAAGRQFEILAENRLDAGFMASPAVVGKALILRTKTHLYRIEHGEP